jgi:hypothetical protein
MVEGLLPIFYFIGLQITDVANGTHREILNIVLNEQEPGVDPDVATIKLQFPPCYVLVKLEQMKARQLEGLPEHVIPIAPISKSFTIHLNSQKLQIMRSQLLMTPAYTFTDYHGQGQTIIPRLIDIGPPPSGGSMPLKMYVALSWGQPHKTIWLPQDFDDKILQSIPVSF